MKRVVLFLLMLAAPLDAFAYGEGARVRGLPQTPSLATAPAGQDWIDTLLTQRFAMIDTVAPMPAASSDDPAAIARRLSALREFSAFAAVTIDRKSTRLNSSHIPLSRMPSSA